MHRLIYRRGFRLVVLRTLPRRLRQKSWRLPHLVLHQYGLSVLLLLHHLQAGRPDSVHHVVRHLHSLQLLQLAGPDLQLELFKVFEGTLYRLLRIHRMQLIMRL